MPKKIREPCFHRLSSKQEILPRRIRGESLPVQVPIKSIQDACQISWRRTEAWRAPDGVPPGALISHQPACKPGSGWRAKSLHARDGHSSGTPVTRRLKQPTRTAGPGQDPEAYARAKARAVPIRSCSRWGLPCRRRCRRRGALLPHRFTLAAAKRNAPRRFVLCGTVPGLASAGCYPAPFVRGARTFLPGDLSVFAGAAVRPTDRTGNGHSRCRRQGRKTSFYRNGLTPACSPACPSAWLPVWRQGASSMAVRARAAIVFGRPRAARSSFKVFRVEVSAKPSTRSGRKWRWKAVTTSSVLVS